MDFSGDINTADAAIKVDSASEFEVLPRLIIAQDEIDPSDAAVESLNQAGDEVNDNHINQSITTEQDTNPSTEPGTSPNTEPDISPNTEPDISPNTEPDISPNTEPDTSPSTEPDTSPSTEPDTSPSTEPDASPSTEPDASPSTEPDASPSTEPDASPSTEPDASPSTEPDASPSTEPDTSPNIEPDTSPNTEPDTTPNTRPDTSPNAESDTSLNTKPDISANSESDSRPNTELETIPNTGPDASPKAEPEISPITEPETSPNTQPDASPNSQINENSDGEVDHDSDDLLQKTAFEIVEDTIAASSLTMQSSGDFSMLNDAEQFKVTTEEQKETEDRGDTNKNFTNENNRTKPECEKDQDLTKKTEDKDDDWMDVLGNGLLKKKVLSPGQGQESRPKKEEEVTVTIETFLMDDSVYEEKKELQFVIGDIEMPYAIDFSVNLMELKEKCKVVSDKKYCVRQDGGPTTEVPHDQLVYIIELLDIQKGPYSSEAPIQKRLNWVEKKRNLGNFIYSNDEFELANIAYKKCLQVLNKASQEAHSDDTKDDIKLLSLKCHNNQSATLMKLGRWKEAKDACTKAEAIDPINIKTLFRKGKILAELGQSKESIAALKKANMINPDDKTVLNELNKQSKRLEQQNKKHMGMCKRMLGDFAKTSEEKDEVKTEKSNGFWSKNSVMFGGSLVAFSAAVLLGFYLIHK